MKIVLIAARIFPYQSPRSFRATNLAIELSHQDHDVTLYANLGSFDYSIFDKINCIKSRNIGRMLLGTPNSDLTNRTNILQRILIKLFKRVLDFPDIEFFFRIHRILKIEKDVDLLISIARPHSIHWGCAYSKSRSKDSFPKVWAADCGDPFMGNLENGAKPFYFKFLEKWFCNKTDYIVVPFEGAKKAYYSDFKRKLEVIPQGYKFDFQQEFDEPNNSVPTFAYAGILYKRLRNPSIFLSYISKLDIDFRFIVYTRSKSFFDPYIDLLGEKLDLRDYIPREQLILNLRSMDFLVNFENSQCSQLPSKLIDYALTKRPILSISIDSLNIDQINEFLDGEYRKQFVVKNIEQYDIFKVAKSFVGLYQRLY